MKDSTSMCGLKELCINNLSLLSFPLCHHHSTLLPLISFSSLFDLSSSALFSVAFHPCRG